MNNYVVVHNFLVTYLHWRNNPLGASSVSIYRSSIIAISSLVIGIA